MVQTERQIERGIAPPGALGIQEHWAILAAQNVLRADIAMHQGMAVALGFGHETMQGRREIGMRVGGRDQIGLQANIVENPIGREVGCNGGRGGGRRVDPHECLRDLRGELRVGVAIAQLRLPERIAVRRQELHRERPGRFVETQQLRR